MRKVPADSQSDHPLSITDHSLIGACIDILLIIMVVAALVVAATAITTAVIWCANHATVLTTPTVLPTVPR